MSIKIKTTIITGAAVTLFSSLVFGATADYYKCVSREGGEWNYGRAPQVCRANSFGLDSYLTTNYSKIVFTDSASRTAERNRYMGEMHALVKEAATTYIKGKKPKSTTAEHNAFVEGVVATAAHESYWSMYRKTADANLKMMRGDFGHGHGLMQIDDRAHFNAVEKGLAWNVATHLTYAMDIYYTAWEKASTQSCVNNASNYWQARVRSAWSAYNGGLGKVCRWTNSADKWAANDKNFYAILTGKKWKAHVSDLNQKTTIPIACLMEKKENCAESQTPGTNQPEDGFLYRVSGKVCLLKNAILNCGEERDRQCLSALGEIKSSKVVELTATQAAGYAQSSYDRHSLCKSYDSKLMAVGSGIRMKKNINLRDTPAGGLVTVIPLGTTLQVRDFEVRESSGDRYYKVRYGAKAGYVFAGDLVSQTSWAEETASNLAEKSTMARVGDTVVITNLYGINIRESAGGNLLGNVPQGKSVVVQEILAQTEANKIYYKITYGTTTGYIYGGFLLPTEILPEWAQVK